MTRWIDARLCFIGQQGGRWKCYIRNHGQDCLSSFLRMQQTNRCQLTVVANVPVMKLKQSPDTYWFKARSVNSYMSYALCIQDGIVNVSLTNSHDATKSWPVVYSQHFSGNKVKMFSYLGHLSNQ